MQFFKHRNFIYDDTEILLNKIFFINQFKSETHFENNVLNKRNIILY